MHFAEPGYKTIAIVRLSSLGDIVHTIPAFNILRNRFPHAKITWFAEPAGAKLLTHISGLDEIAAVHLKVNGSANKLKELGRILRQYKNRFDVVIDFQGLLKSAVLTWLLKGKSIGFGKSNLKESQARFFYNRNAAAFDETQHVIYKNIHLVHQLPPIQDTPSPPPVVYPLEPIKISQPLQRFMTEKGLKEKDYVIVNVGGGWETKLLEPRQYTRLVNGIKGRLRPVVLWGNGKEQAVAQQVSSETGATMTPFLDFSELMAFIRSARLVVTSDTLALHAADMVETPSVGFFGPTSPQRNGSLLKESTAVFEKTACRFCYKKKCGTIDCIKNMDVQTIIRAIEKVCKL